MINNNARWIWYPSDFELYLNILVHTERFERGLSVPAFWRLDNYNPSVFFKKKVNAKNDFYFNLHCDGTPGLSIDGRYIYNMEEPILVTAGEHEIIISVFNKKSVPSIFIDSNELKTDDSWEVTLGDKIFVKVDYLSFTDKNSPPSSFAPYTKKMEPVSKEYINGGVLFDFSKEMMSVPIIEGINGTNKLKICYGESKTEALDVDNCEIFDKITCHNNFHADFTRAFRYIFIPLEKNVTIDKVYALYEYFGYKNKGAFNCSDELINNIYDTAVYTLELNSRYFFLDGIKRDRWVWSGDATQSYILNYYSFLDNDICKRTMRVLIGRVPIPMHLNSIQDYTLYWFISLYDYYLYTGDLDFIISMYDRAKTVMDYCINLTDEQGFIKTQEIDWVFIDWADISKDGTISFMQMLYARALESIAKIAKLASDDVSYEKYQAMYDKTFTNMMNTFWDKENEIFIHSINSTMTEEKYKVSRYANMFSMFFNYIEKDKYKHIAKAVLTNDEVNPITTPYMKFYELMALCEGDQKGLVLDYMRNYWGGMLDLGATSFWEEYNPNLSGDEHYAMYGRKYGKSLCHAWSAGPICLLLKYMIGVSPIKPSYEEFIVTPDLCDLEFMEGTVPTPIGNIEVYVDKAIVKIKNNTTGVGKLSYNGINEVIKPNCESVFTVI